MAADVALAAQLSPTASVVALVVIVLVLVGSAAFATLGSRRRLAAWQAFADANGLRLREEGGVGHRVVLREGRFAEGNLSCRAEIRSRGSVGTPQRQKIGWTRVELSFDRPLPEGVLFAHPRLRELSEAGPGVAAMVLAVFVDGAPDLGRLRPIATGDASFDREVAAFGDAGADAAPAARATIRAFLAGRPRSFVTERGVFHASDRFLDDLTAVVPSMRAVAAALARTS